MNEDQPAGVPRRPFPPGRHEDFLEFVLSEFRLDSLDVPFQLPENDGSFESISAYVDQELKVQSEIMREELCRRVHGVTRPLNTERSPPEKHLSFPMPRGISDWTELVVGWPFVSREPVKGKFTNYFFLVQTKQSESEMMQNQTLAFCTYCRKVDGVGFRLGSDAAANLSRLGAGEMIYCRPLGSPYTFLKTHIQALVELRSKANVLEKSFVTRQLLEGRFRPEHIHRLSELDAYCTNSESQSPVELEAFNKQQQRALALESLTEEGAVLIQGPPGTGKSHIVCHGILPQVVSRNEKVLVVCNSNIAVDALLLKCTEIDSLQGNLVRVGFKRNVSSEIVEKGLYAEGDISRALDRYGDGPGADSNTGDTVVQSQIRSSRVVFTTIHFASKEKAKSTGNEEYWNFDTLVLDEAAQLEDAKLFVVLARCPSLKKIILVGDPKQLQPYISDSLRQQGHGKSTMERLMDSTAANTDSSVPYIMLEEQFRMAPMLRELVSQMFYNGRLTDGSCVLSRGPSANVSLKPLLVVNVTGTKMSYSPLHQSYENESEAAVVKEIYDFIFGSDFDGALPESLERKDVCLLTPFNRHKDRLRSEICHVSDENADSYSGHTFGRGASSPLKKSQAMLGTPDSVDSDVEAQLENIDTVDKFQGSERKVVIISTCVDKKPLRASDPHFIDVACSRAQHLLVVVGNFTDGLASDPNWQLVRRYAEESGSYIEHSVKVDSEGRCDIDSPLLRAKLVTLVERPSKRPRKETLPVQQRCIMKSMVDNS